MFSFTEKVDSLHMKGNKVTDIYYVVNYVTFMFFL